MFKDKKNIIILLLTIALAVSLFFLFFRKSREASHTDQLIMGIGEVTLERKDVIDEARASYDALTEDQKKDVEHLDVLLQAEGQYAVLYDQNEAEKADRAILEIGTVTLEKREELISAREQYEALTDTQKKYVTEYNTLLEKEEEYQELERKKVDEEIEALAEEIKEQGYELTEQIISQVELLREEFEQLSKEDIEGLENNDLFEMIRKAMQLKEVKTVQQLITEAISSGTGIEEAINSYNSLTNQEKSEIQGYEDLEEAKAYWETVHAREDYIAGCEAVTYDQLNRYPDTWKGKQIRLKADITPENKLKSGELLATIAGTSQQIALIDNRIISEPAFTGKERIMVYGTAEGPVKTDEGTELPSIKVLYTETDAINGEPSSKTTDYYEAGKAIAQELNGYLSEIRKRLKQ